jgi:hypothetical protein
MALQRERRTAPELQRTAFETSRAADYLDAGALEKETGAY